jgi:hypothetical protein
MGFNWSFFIVLHLCFGANVGPTARVSELMEQAQQEFAGTAQMYINYGIYQ